MLVGPCHASLQVLQVDLVPPAVHPYHILTMGMLEPWITAKKNELALAMGLSKASTNPIRLFWSKVHKHYFVADTNGLQPGANFACSTPTMGGNTIIARKPNAPLEPPLFADRSPR